MHARSLLVAVVGLSCLPLALPATAASTPCPSGAFMTEQFARSGQGLRQTTRRGQVRWRGTCGEQQCDSALRVRADHTEPVGRTQARLSHAARSEIGRTTQSAAVVRAIRCRDQRHPLFGPNEGPVPPPGFGDPVYNAIMDSCMGHTARQYHYHALVETCFDIARESDEPSPILAFGSDGFPVYGPYGCRDEECSEVIQYKSSWEQLRAPRIDTWDAYRFVPKDGAEYLDRCNGHSGDDQGGAYHYHATATFPYIMGCFSGTPSADAGRASDRQISRRDGGLGGGPGDDPRPTAEQVSEAAAKLAIDEHKLAEALRLTDGRVAPMNFAAAARALEIDARDLYEALGVTAQVPPRGARGGPGGRRRGVGPQRQGGRPPGPRPQGPRPRQ